MVPRLFVFMTTVSQKCRWIGTGCWTIFFPTHGLSAGGDHVQDAGHTHNLSAPWCASKDHRADGQAQRNPSAGSYQRCGSEAMPPEAVSSGPRPRPSDHLPCECAAFGYCGSNQNPMPRHAHIGPASAPAVQSMPQAHCPLTPPIEKRDT